MNKVNISVIIPSYNAEKSISKCLESLINQTKKVFEIIIIDDGSTDKTRIICEKYIRKYQNLLYFYQENAGVSSARNNGIHKARGSHICFIDSDDYVDSKFIESLSEKVDDGELIVSGYSREFYIKKKLKRIILKSPGNLRLWDEESYNSNFCNLYENAFFNNPWAKLYRLDIIKKNKIYFDTELWYGEDCIFNLSYLNKISKIITINNTYYHYICSENESLTVKYDSKKYDVSDLIYKNVNIFLNYKNINYNRYKVDKVYLKSTFLNLESIWTRYRKKELVLKEAFKIINNINLKSIISKNRKGSIMFSFYKKLYSIESKIILYHFIRLRLVLKKIYLKM